jgi:hypothetical protein
MNHVTFENHTPQRKVTELQALIDELIAAGKEGSPVTYRQVLNVGERSSNEGDTWPQVTIATESITYGRWCWRPVGKRR